jgi:hypothetical protein
MFYKEHEERKNKKRKFDLPEAPLDRITNESLPYICPLCGSSAKRVPRIFGAIYCINSECFHYYHLIRNEK